MKFDKVDFQLINPFYDESLINDEGLKKYFLEASKFMCYLYLEHKSPLGELTARFFHDVIYLECRSLIKDYYSLNQIWYEVW